MTKRDIVVLILLILTIVIHIISPSDVVKIIALMLFFLAIIALRLKCHNDRKKSLEEIDYTKKGYMKYKENSKQLLLSSILVVNSINGINTLIHNKTMDIFLNNEKEISGFVDLISRLNLHERLTLLTYAIIFMLGIWVFIEHLISVTIISDDKIVFYDGITFENSKITCLKHKDPLFSIGKKKRIIISQDKYEKEIVVKLEEFEKVKNYLEEKTSLVFEHIE